MAKYTYAVITTEDEEIKVYDLDIIELIDTFYSARNKSSRDYYLTLIGNKLNKEVKRLGKYFKSAL